MTGNFKRGVAGGMHSNTEIPSLAHYLESPDARFQIKLLPRQKETSIQEDDDFFFSTIGDSDPYASIIEASIVSDTGSEIKDLFILIQKDDYHLAKTGSWPSNNRHIDQAWQELFTYLRDSNQKDSIVIFKDQVDDNGRLVQWSPLFYCRYKQIFFQPPCPLCGFPLKICDDDALLIRTNLKPYGTSLTRYLYCPHCNDTANTSLFYVRTRDVSDSTKLQDQHDLIKGLGRLVLNGNEQADIPCHDCSNFQECYYGDHLSDSRVVVVSFYPFFAIAVDAPSINVLDFLPLIAGADHDDVANRLQAQGQWGRLTYIKNFNVPDSSNSLNFLDRAQKHLHEVLYLKLCLLGQLAQLVLEGLDQFKYPDLTLSLDRIWVKVSDQSAMMPAFWNFKLQYIGIDGDSNQPSFPYTSDQSYALSFLGASWFSVLFMNSRQDASLINSEIEKMTNLAISRNGLNPEARLKIFQSHAFSPENILWNPNQKIGDEDITDFLRQSLDLGFFLIKSSFEEIQQWSQTDFWKQYEQLIAQIKNALFMVEMERSSVFISDATRDIYDILVRIARKWRSDMETPSPEPERAMAGLSIKGHEIDAVNAVSSEDVLIRKTVVLTPDMFGEEPPSPDISEDRQPETSMKIAEPALPSDTLDYDSKSTEDIPETRIINQEDRLIPSTEPQDDDIPETVVISTNEPPASRKNSQMKREGDSAKQGQTTQTGQEDAEGSADDETSAEKIKHDEDDVPKTVIINYKKSQGGQ